MNGAQWICPFVEWRAHDASSSLAAPIAPILSAARPLHSARREFGRNQFGSAQCDMCGFDSRRFVMSQGLSDAVVVLLERAAVACSFALTHAHAHQHALMSALMHIQKHACVYAQSRRHSPCDHCTGATRPRSTCASECGDFLRNSFTATHRKWISVHPTNIHNHALASSFATTAFQRTLRTPITIPVQIDSFLVAKIVRPDICRRRNQNFLDFCPFYVV